MGKLYLYLYSEGQKEKLQDCPFRVHTPRCFSLKNFLDLKKQEVFSRKKAYQSSYVIV